MATKLAAKKVSSKKLSAKKTASENLPVADSADVSTPQWLFDHCNRLAVEACGHPFEVDACAAEWNAKVPTYWTVEQDCLKQDWTQYKSIYCNPPFTTELLAGVVQKAVEAKQTTTTVLIVPNLHDQPWYVLCEQQGRIHEIKSHARFTQKGGKTTTLNIPSRTTSIVVVVFGPNVQPGAGTAIREDAPVLNPEDQALREQLEAVVESWWDSTLQAAEALWKINTKKLYQSTHATFRAYVEDRFGKTRQWGYDLVRWYEINVLAETTENPLAISAARLLKAYRKDQKTLQKIVKEAKRLAAKDGKDSPTAEHVAEAKAKVTGKAPAEKSRFVPLNTVTAAVKHLTILADWLDPETMAAEERSSLKPEIEEIEKLLVIVKQKMKPFWTKEGF
jgi:phage N-6-adenine-methyltransferase